MRSAKILCYRLVYPIVALYWRVTKPTTFGVKALLTRRVDDSFEVLLTQSSYGSRHLWNLPGGGYRPMKESAEEAVRREVFEELGITIESLREMGEYKTDGQGKRDTVTIFTASIEWNDPAIANLSAETLSSMWIAASDIKARKFETAIIVRRAIEIFESVDN